MVTVVSAMVAFAPFCAQEPFSVTPIVAEPRRLALTPRVDGKSETGEWEPFVQVNGKEAYLQWEPRKLHLAGSVEGSGALVFTLDLNNDGWLKGKDNLEIVLTAASGNATLSARWLDATSGDGPSWVAAPEIERSASVQGAPIGDGVFLEASLSDPGLGVFPFRDGDVFGARVDAEPSSDAESVKPYLPRSTAELRAVMSRGVNLPAGVSWGRQAPHLSAGPGAEFRMRITFSAKERPGLQRVNMSVEGPGSSEFAVLATPFPGWDSKGRAFVDYQTPIPLDAVPGYRVFRTEVVDESGQVSVLKTSWQVAPLVFFDAVLPRRIEPADEPREWRLPIYISTRSPDRYAGEFQIELPSGWQLKDGSDKRFVLRGFNASARRVLLVNLPAVSPGPYPLRFVANVGGRKLEQVVWVNVG